MKQTSFTEDRLTDALRALKADTSDERFRLLTSEPPKARIRPLLWYGVAASVAMLIVAASIWQSSWSIHPDTTPTATTATVDENLSQLVGQSIAAQTQAQQQRTLTNDIVSEHLSLVEP